MARTKQTARRSTGGRAPSWGQSFGGDNQSSLVQIFTTTSTRTIAVDGEDEIEVDPDTVRMSFQISEERRDSMEAIQAVLTRLSEARAKLESVGVSKDSITSDSVSMRTRSAVLQDGIEVEDNKESETAPGFGASSFGAPTTGFGNSSFEAPTKKYKPTKEGKEYISLFNAIIILRVVIDGEGLTTRFGGVMLGMMEIGLCCYEAPIYTLSTLTDHRNEARCNAVTNAMEKAKLMVTALGEDVGVTLGSPISINDIPKDIVDDAADSFVFHPWYLSFHESRTTTVSVDSSKRTADLTGMLSQFALETLFSIAPVRINACVRVIFEIVPTTTTSVIKEN